MKTNLCCLGLLTILIGSVGLRAQRSAPDPKLVAALDQCIQDRLADTTTRRFGISRVMLVHQPDFQPESEFEEMTVAAIAREDWSVRVFFGSRGLMLPRASPGDVSRGAAISGPSLRIDPSLPAALRDEARKAFESFSGRATAAEFRLGDWYVAARPVRASTQECVDCHKRRPFSDADATLAKGDLLGVAIYAFARSKGQ